MPGARSNCLSGRSLHSRSGLNAAPQAGRLQRPMPRHTGRLVSDVNADEERELRRLEGSAASPDSPDSPADTEVGDGNHAEMSGPQAAVEATAEETHTPPQPPVRPPPRIGADAHRASGGGSGGGSGGAAAVEPPFEQQEIPTPPIYAESCQQDVNNMVQNILGAFKNLKGRPTYLCVWKAYNIWHTCAQRTSHNCHYMIHPPS